MITGNRCPAAKSFLVETETLAEELVKIQEVPLQFPAVVQPEQAIAFVRGLTILSRRSDILAARAAKGESESAACGALILARKIIEGKGTIGLYMHGVAGEVRALGAAKRRLFSNLYRGPALLFENFPDHRENNKHLANCYRTEYQWVLATTGAPIQDLLMDPLQIDWWGVGTASNLAPWPSDIDRSYIDEEKTTRGFAEMISAEIDFYENNRVKRPNHAHLWSDLPPRASRRDSMAIDRFYRAVHSIDNPVGKSCLRNASVSFHLIWNISKARVSRVRRARIWASLLAQRKI
jgi:hypothetical protein